MSAIRASVRAEHRIDERAIEAARLMLGFAERTGLAQGGVERRYLWTDAFAVCNWLELARRTGVRGYQELALYLVDRVHDVLGRHRGDDGRQGWLSGASESEGAERPTSAGLRIGKPLPERRVCEAVDQELEWDRDGQYFHYLVQWMHALDQVARSTGQSRYNLWARELGAVAWRSFRFQPSEHEPPSVAWKMSIDLSRPLILSSGRQDALHGLVGCLELEQTRGALSAPGPTLDPELSELAASALHGSWVTADPLGTGGLLWAAGRVAELVAGGALANEWLLSRLLTQAFESLQLYAARGELAHKSDQRLAFRELGLSIGLSAIERVQRAVLGAPVHFRRRTELSVQLEQLRHYVPLGSAIQDFWLQASARTTPAWLARQDINEVMLATSLVPQGFLGFPPAPKAH